MQFIVEVIESSTGSPHCLGVNHLDAMVLRRWDDRAKVHGVEVPDLDAYRKVILDHLL